MIAKFRKRFAALDTGLATLAKLRSRSDGSIVVEYGLIAAIIVIVLIVLLTQLRTGLLALPFPTLFAAFQSALS